MKNTVVFHTPFSYYILGVCETPNTASTHVASNQAIQQMYINVHFCYAYKFGIVTNGLDIVRDITFYNKEFLRAHPDIVVEKKSDSPGQIIHGRN